MELQNVCDLDSVQIGKHRFVIVNGHFCEVFYPTVGNGNNALLVDWSMSQVHVGYKGAMGSVSQSKGIAVNISTMSSVLGDSSPGNQAIQTNNSGNQATAQSQDVYKTRYNNVYYIYSNGKARKFKNKKQLLKLFPDRVEEVEKTLHRHHVDFQLPQTVIDAVLDIMQK